MWFEQDDYPLFRSIHYAQCPFFYSSFSSNHCLVLNLYVVRHDSDPNYQRRPLPFLLSDSSFMGTAKNSVKTPFDLQRMNIVSSKVLIN